MFEERLTLTERKRVPRIFPGWWTVVASIFLAGWGQGFNIYGFSLFFKPLSSELGFNRAATSIAAGIGTFEGGVEAPLSGWITDKFGPRWITFIGVFLVGLGLVLMYFINSLWAFLVVWGGILGTGSNLGLTVPIQTAIANWFVKKRGLALGLRQAVGISLTSLVVLLIAWLIDTVNWRMTCVIGGVVVWLIGLPLVLLFVKQHRPEYYGLLPDGAKIDEKASGTNKLIEQGVKYAAEAAEVEFTLKQAVKTRTFWLLIIATVVPGLVEPVMRTHSVPFLTDLNIDPLKAASFLTILTLSSVPARLLGGFMVDRVKKEYLRFLLAGGYLLQAVGIIVFLLNQTIAMIYFWFILYGIGHGVAMSILIPMRGRYFGRKAFGSIMGLSSMFLTPVGVAAPIYAGWVYDTTHSYINAFTLFAIMLAIAAVIMSFINPPKSPDQTENAYKTS